MEGVGDILVRFPNCIVYSWVYNTQKTVKFFFDGFHSLHLAMHWYKSIIIGKVRVSSPGSNWKNSFSFTQFKVTAILLPEFVTLIGLLNWITKKKPNITHDKSESAEMWEIQLIWAFWWKYKSGGGSYNFFIFYFLKYCFLQYCHILHLLKFSFCFCFFFFPFFCTNAIPLSLFWFFFLQCHLLCLCLFFHWTSAALIHSLSLSSSFFLFVCACVSVY